jgi:hypothetical protein
MLEESSDGLSQIFYFGLVFLPWNVDTRQIIMSKNSPDEFSHKILLILEFVRQITHSMGSLKSALINAVMDTLIIRALQILKSPHLPCPQCFVRTLHNPSPPKTLDRLISY